MSGRTLGRRIGRLEHVNYCPYGDSPDVLLRAIERRDRRNEAVRALVDFARSLAGTLEAPPAPESLSGIGATADAPQRRRPALRDVSAPIPAPAPPPRPRFDPSFGGRIIGAHGGLGDSADALLVMPPPPEPEPPPPVPPERYPWEHWGVPPPEGWVMDGAATRDSDEAA